MPGYDLVIIGHVTDDFLIQQGKTTRFIGGGAYFSAFAASRSNVNLCLVAKLARKDYPLLDGLKQEGIEVIAIPSRQTTSIENIYENDDVDRRRVRLLSQADPIFPEEIPPRLEAKVFSLSGLFDGDIPDSLITHLAGKGEIALDLQAKLRFSEGGNFAFRDWHGKERYLPLITYLKADSQEAEVIAGTTDRDEAAVILQRQGAREVMITHASEVIVYDGAEIYRAPFTPRNLSGRTGRGDTCLVSYVCFRLTHGIAESLRYAAALTSLKMEAPGPFRGTQREVFARMAAPTG